MDTPFKSKTISLKNIRSVKFFVNDKEVYLDKDVIINEGDEVKIKKIIRFKTFEDSEIILEGYNYKNPILNEDIVEI